MHKKSLRVIGGIFLFLSAVAGTASARARTSAVIGTADALFPTFLCFVDIQSCTAKNEDKDCDDNDICHINHFFPERVYSAFTFLSALTQR